MIKLFFTFELEKIWKYLKTTTLAKVITGLLFTLVFFGIGIGIYYYFVSGFRYINVGAEEDIRLALSLFLYELFFLILASVIIFSTIISTIFNLFRGDTNEWVISSPFYRFFPGMVFMRSVTNSLIPLLIMFLPAILALDQVYSLNILSLFFILITVILFLVMLNSLTLFTVVSTSFIYYKISQKVTLLRFRFGGLLLLFLFMTTAITSFVVKTFISVDLMGIFKANEVSSGVSISAMANHFTFLPTHPIAMEIINWQIGQERNAFIYFFISLALSVVSVFILWCVSFLFYPLWQKFQEGSTHTSLVKKDFFMKRAACRFEGTTTIALLKKEALISSRNFKGVLWFVFILFVWLLQIGVNMILDSNIQKYQHDMSQKIATLQVIQYLIAIYFISSFTLRFVFPSFSVEKKMAWILSSAPLSFKRIFFGKYLFYTSFFVVVGILMNYINNIILKVSFTNAFYSMTLFISVIIFIVTLGLAMGALFPSNETDDPEVVSTSMPGLFFTALALIYGALSDWVLYLTLRGGNIAWLVMFVVITFILVGVMLLKTPSIAKNRSSR